MLYHLFLEASRTSRKFIVFCDELTSCVKTIYMIFSCRRSHNFITQLMCTICRRQFDLFDTPSLQRGVNKGKSRAVGYWVDMLFCCVYCQVRRVTARDFRRSDSHALQTVSFFFLFFFLFSFPRKKPRVCSWKKTSVAESQQVVLYVRFQSGLTPPAE